MWTMEELLERVREALAAEYPGAPNGRVRELPDRRAVRWYATTGLVDRATAMRGRTALYGPRHLLQIVAVKRRQAEGHSLAAIQAELAGATDAELAALARVPADVLGGDAPADVTARPRFWTSAPAAPAETPAPASTAPAATSTAPGTASTTPATTSPAPATATPAAPAAATPAASTKEAPAREVGAVSLGGGVFLLLPVRPDAADLDGLAHAAQPLIDLLKARGLTNDGGNR
ncbi:MerR family transcriptional regulator [Catenuloplanes sp. NPDC051500]|uniref:MerR family transcriptional regulator n=1 Tax=Catenuloplanes sp. NPDC051500 TaxID=3363959 RepID=UPI0037B82ED1